MGTATELLTRPDYSFQIAVREEARLRPQFFRLEPPPIDRHPLALAADDLLVKSAVLLELTLVAASTHESLDSDVTKLRRLKGDQLESLLKRVQRTSGLDPQKVVNDAVQHFAIDRLQGEQVELSRAAVVRAVRALLEACPIGPLEVLANARRMESLGHRARVAYDGLQAYVIRNDPREDERIRIVGAEYALGTFSLDQVASLLGLHPVDAIELLETRGFSRGVDVIRLTEEERISRLTQIRAERLARAGRRPDVSREWTARNVVASERLENVDARRWVPREAQ